MIKYIYMLLLFLSSISKASIRFDWNGGLMITEKSIKSYHFCDLPGSHNAPMSDEQKLKVMHAQLMLTETGGISGADALWPIVKGGAVSIHAHLSNESLAQKVFSALSEGGIVLGELAANPPPDDSGISGSVKDKYGFTWIISALKS